VAGTLIDARKLDINTLDVAILDVNIGPLTSYAFARQLLDAGVAVAFVSGSQRSDVPADLIHVLFLAKPCSHSAMLDFIHHAMPSVAKH
jgi:FixJ family two-component response regulator